MTLKYISALPKRGKNRIQNELETQSGCFDITNSNGSNNTGKHQQAQTVTLDIVDFIYTNLKTEISSLCI